MRANSVLLRALARPRSTLLRPACSLSASIPQMNRSPSMSRPLVRHNAATSFSHHELYRAHHDASIELVAFEKGWLGSSLQRRGVEAEVGTAGPTSSIAALVPSRPGRPPAEPRPLEFELRKRWPRRTPLGGLASWNSDGVHRNSDSVHLERGWWRIQRSTRLFLRTCRARSFEERSLRQLQRPLLPELWVLGQTSIDHW